MLVLVVETDPHSADDAVTELRDAGHEVVRCHDNGRPAFPCNALCDGSTCPLDSAPGVDVLLDYRAHPYPRPTAFEDGTSCAARRHIPVVVAGATALNPFAKWTTTIADRDSIVEACELAAKAPIESLSDVARTKVRQLLWNDPDAANAADVIVTRSSGRLEAVISLPNDVDEVDASLAVGVAGAIRTRDHWTPQVDVCVRRAPAPVPT
jgi:hypothetical protein